MMNRHEMCVSLQSLGAQEQAWIPSGELNEGLPKTWEYIKIRKIQAISCYIPIYNIHISIPSVLSPHI